MCPLSETPKLEVKIGAGKTALSPLYKVKWTFFQKDVVLFKRGTKTLPNRGLITISEKFQITVPAPITDALE